MRVSGAGYSLSFCGLLAVQIGRFGQMITGDDIKVVLYVVQGRELRLQLLQLRFLCFQRFASASYSAASSFIDGIFPSIAA